MFDFSNLSDYEFEILSKDVLSRITSENLSIFKQGKDGGIDISNGKPSNLLIAQAKRFTTNYSLLKKSLIKYKEDVKNISPKKLFIVTSLGLTPNNKKEIFKMFEDYMQDENNIIDGNNLSQFLEKTENNDIVNKNFKLWMVASNVLSNFIDKHTDIDSICYIEDIIKNKNTYVETQGFYDSLKTLKEHNLLLITGDPGIGKTTLTNMLVLKYFGNGYQVYFSSNRNIESLKRLLSKNDNTKQLFVIDDFLGQVCIDLNSDKINELKYLISAIKNKPNKILILNSRIAILNAAQQKYSVPFNTILWSMKKYQINLNDINDYERGKMLYNHLYFSDIEEDYFNEIKKNRNYLKIVKHKNFNPRIIEFATNKTVLNNNKVECSNYFKYIMDTLNFPEDVWKNEIENNLSKADRILLQTLYSLTDYDVPYEILEKSVNKRLKLTSDIDHTIPNFNNSINVLNGSCIKISISSIHSERRVSVINPSVNDYLKKVITSNSEITNEIIKSASTIQQYERFDNNFIHGQIIKSLIDSGEFFELNSLNETPLYYFLNYIVKNDVHDEKYRSKILEALGQEKDFNDIALFREEYINLANYFFLTDAYDVYTLKGFVNSDKFIILLNKLSLKEMDEFLIKFLQSKKNDIVNINTFFDNVKSLIIEKIENDTIDEITEQLNSILYDIEKEDDFNYKDYDFLNDVLNDEISDLSYTIANDLLKNSKIAQEIKIVLSNNNYSNILNNIDTDSAIFDFIQKCEEEEGYEYMDYKEFKYYSHNFDNLLDDMFNT